MGTIRKLQILIAMKFLTLKNAKFYSSEIKWVYSILCGLPRKYFLFTGTVPVFKIWPNWKD